MSGLAEYRVYRQRMLDAIAVYDRAHADVERIEAAALRTWRERFAGAGRETMYASTPEWYAVPVVARGGVYDQACSRRASALARVHTWATVALVMRPDGG
jgi:uncharacterized membrane protein